MKKGDKVYCCNIDEYEGKIELEEWHVSHVDNEFIYLKEFHKFTWVKKSKTNFDYGWAKAIPDYWKDKFPIGTSITKTKYFKSKAAAYRGVLPELKKKADKLNRMVTRLVKKSKKS